MSKLTPETYIKSISKNKAGFYVVSYGKTRTSRRDSTVLYKQLKDLVDGGERFQVKIGNTYMTDTGVDIRSQLNAREMKTLAGQHFLAQAVAEGVDPSDFPEDIQDFMTEATATAAEPEPEARAEAEPEPRAAGAAGGAGGAEEEKEIEPRKPKKPRETREQILKRMSEARAEAEIEEAEERIAEEARARRERRGLKREATRERKEQEAEMEVGRSRPAEQPEGPTARGATKPGRAMRGRGGAGGPGAAVPAEVQRDDEEFGDVEERIRVAEARQRARTTSEMRTPAPAEQPQAPAGEATRPRRAIRGRGGAGGPGAAVPAEVQRDEPELEGMPAPPAPAEQPQEPAARGATRPGRAMRGRGGAEGPGAAVPAEVQRDEPELGDVEERIRIAEARQRARTTSEMRTTAPLRRLTETRGDVRRLTETRGGARRLIETSESKGPVVESESKDEPGAAGGPPPPPPPGSSVVPVPEADAKKALAEDEQPSLDPSTEVKLIGPDSAKEMKEANIIYKDAFRMVFSDRSGVRELERFKASEEAKQAESKTPDALFMEADDIRRVYEDQMKIARLAFNVVDEKKDLEAQWNELNVLAKGTNENLKGKPNQDVLGQFNSVGVVVDISNLGMNLQDFMNYINARNLTNQTDKQKGNNKLSGFQKGVNLEDVEPADPPKPDPPTIEPIPTTKALADPAQEVGVFGKPEFISNERVKGVINVSGFKKPVKKEKSKRVVIML